MIRRIINCLSNKQSVSRFSKDISIQEGTTVSQDSEIGEYTYIGYNCFITRSNVGRYCSIANNVSIGLGEHDVSRISTNSLFYESPYEELTQLDCIIEDDVWIGVDSIIRRGVKIGFGAVIGANSFVNKDVPPFTIVAGNPAKIIGSRFNEAQQLMILESKWWQASLEDAQEILKELKQFVDAPK